MGVDPADKLLIGPALAMPLALQRAGMDLGEVDLVEIHEAFAAQVLCVTQALRSTAFARERLGRDQPPGAQRRQPEGATAPVPGARCPTWACWSLESGDRIASARPSCTEHLFVCQTDRSSQSDLTGQRVWS